MSEEQNKHGRSLVQKLLEDDKIVSFTRLQDDFPRIFMERSKARLAHYNREQWSDAMVKVFQEKYAKPVSDENPCTEIIIDYAAIRPQGERIGQPVSAIRPEQIHEVIDRIASSVVAGSHHPAKTLDLCVLDEVQADNDCEEPLIVRAKSDGTIASTDEERL